jgi:hypothetical protein
VKGCLTIFDLFFRTGFPAAVSVAAEAAPIETNKFESGLLNASGLFVVAD